MGIAAGLVFGLGLIVSGMTDPGKLTGFVDLAGARDPSLALVMGSMALVVREDAGRWRIAAIRSLPER